MLFCHIRAETRLCVLQERLAKEQEEQRKLQKKQVELEIQRKKEEEARFVDHGVVSLEVVDHFGLFVGVLAGSALSRLVKRRKER